MRKKIYLALGSNVGDREKYLQSASCGLKKGGFSITRVSSIYETAPIGYVEQKYFLNQVIEIESDKSIDEIFSLTQSIENALGRKRSIKWGPRIIDIDILLYGDEIVDEPQLQIPHQEMTKRRFVLEPLCEIDNNISIPPENVSVCDYLNDVRDQAISVYTKHLLKSEIAICHNIADRNM